MFTKVKELSDVITDEWVELCQMDVIDEGAIKWCAALSVMAIPVLPITSITYLILYSKTLSKLKKLKD